MSLLEKASLILTPNAVKASKLYSIVPSTGNGDMDVVRATTATRVNSLGLIENVASNVARLNYDGSCPSILLEPQRTNLVSYSEDFSNASWVKNSTVILSNNNLSPNGGLNATRLTSDVGNPNIQQVFTGTIGQTYTTSFWVRRISGTSQIYLRAGDLTLINISPTNVWQRFSATNTSTSTTIRCEIGFVNPVLNTDIIEIWGAQLEVGSYPTSYIPTVASTVTRNADVISKTGISDLIGQTEGVMFIESAALFNDLTQRVVSLSDGTSSNRMFIRYLPTSNQIQFWGVQNGVTFTNNIIYNITDETQFAKIAVRYRANDMSFWINGIKRGTDITSQILPINLSRFGFDRGDGIEAFFSKTKQVQLYKTYLTDTEMANLTTL